MNMSVDNKVFRIHSSKFKNSAFVQSHSRSLDRSTDAKSESLSLMPTNQEQLKKKRINMSGLMAKNTLKVGTIFREKTKEINHLNELKHRFCEFVQYMAVSEMELEAEREALGLEDDDTVEAVLSAIFSRSDRVSIYSLQKRFEDLLELKVEMPELKQLVLRVQSQVQGANSDFICAR